MGMTFAQPDSRVEEGVHSKYGYGLGQAAGDRGLVSRLFDAGIRIPKVRQQEHDSRQNPPDFMYQQLSTLSPRRRT
jgi:hypothetical protein